MCTAQALALLQRISQQVQPVMRKRRWKVPLLSEFSPKNPNLLVQKLSMRYAVSTCKRLSSIVRANAWAHQLSAALECVAST